MGDTPIRETAFAKWLNNQSIEAAGEHLFQCMAEGSKDNMAWAVMEFAHGKNWRFPIEMMPAACQEAARRLRMTQEEDDNYDPTPWCHHCGAMKRKDCQCGPIPEND